MRSTRTSLTAIGARALLLTMLTGCSSEGSSAGDAGNNTSDTGDATLDATTSDGATPDTSDAAPDEGSIDDATPDADDAASDAGELPFVELAPERCGEFGPELPLFDRSLAEVAPELRRWAPLTPLLDFALLGETLSDNEAAVSLAESLRARARAAVDSCNSDRNCLAEAFGLNALERTLAATELTEYLGATPGAVTRIFAMRESTGLFATPASDDTFESIIATWIELQQTLQANALRRALGELNDDDITNIVVNSALDERAGRFDAITNVLVRDVMVAAGRDEAIRYEPLLAGENAAAAAVVETTDFDAFRFAVILVPGQGPTDETTALSPAGADRVDLAVERYRAGLAPFVLVSGGHVHPDRTVYSEAIEMKRYLLDVHGLPESAVLVDPYARHTTTNLRNAARTMASVGISLDRPVLVTSDPFQSVYIAAGIEQRAVRELGYRPWRSLVALGPNDSCAILTRESLQIDANDPLDP
jgi:hypothetical protein